MKEMNIENIWDKHGTGLNNSLHLNHEALKNTEFKSSQLQLNRLAFRRLIEGVFFMLIFILLSAFIINNSTAPQYVISGAILGIFSLIGATGSFWEISLILRIDYSKPVTDLLTHIEKIKLFGLQILKLLLLSTPFYFAYIIIGFKVLFDYDIYSNGDAGWLIINLALTVVLIPVSIYFIKQLKINTKRTWVKKILADNGGKQIDAAIQFINEIDEYKKPDRKPITKQ